MSGMLHPIGPEPAQTYWLRRALVVAAAVLALVLFAVAVANATGSGSASPSPAPGLPADSARPTRQTPTPAASRTATPPTAAPASPRARTDGRPSTTARPPATPSAARATRTASPTPAVPTCDPDRLRVTLTGARTLRPGQPVRFVVSVINGSRVTCVTGVNPKNFELRIYSGRDRIFTTGHCARGVAARAFALIPEEAHVWSVAWNGRRSRSECRTRPEVPRPGTYVATADLDGADPVRLRLRLAD